MSYPPNPIFLKSAEKALATLNLRPISKTNPSFVLSLSLTQECTPLASILSGHPRLVKLLPKNYTDEDLYDLLRPFGPLASVRVDKELGGIVQFWTEADAQAAERAVRQAFARKSKITLHAYDPCNLYCAVCLGYLYC
jgi:polyadenylate-binding protein